ncbi:MAG: hypothetical protein LBK94_04790 [Prevotellaceae bacterium]|jgi:hypothetical protein|nr:hypothetical protein [Prevotellaceae bacterium]
MINIEKIDEIYIRYGYEIKKNHKGARVYLFTKSIYNGADIIKLSDECDIDKLRKEYSNEGFAIKIRNFASEEETETILFDDFFKVDGVTQNLKRKYEDFVGRLMKNLPNESRYEYINSTYEVIEYDKDGMLLSEIATFQDGLVPKVTSLINDRKGPLFIILEAAAGYGKTCTAYEVLNQFLSISKNKIPFFTELSRDRKATIFSHILRKEIEDQFANRVDSKVVIHEIKQGRIPLIIDGFDELIAKDFSFSSGEFEQVESMLSTIVELLSGNAKIIITSRKTAIFNSEEFYNWMIDRNIDYSMIKITITEPQIGDWLSNEKIAIIKDNEFPIEEIANPVLLTYLRYIETHTLQSMIETEQSIVNNYLNFLLEREQTRQNLLIEPDTQLRIFRKLVRLFSEFDIKAASKEDIKEMILEYNKTILKNTLEKYQPELRPRIEQLADTLSNHAFLDRKDNRNIGFINELILGTLIGQSLANGKYEEHIPDFHTQLSQMFSLLAVHAYKVQNGDEKLRLWEIFYKFNFPYDKQFFFSIDIWLRKELITNYYQDSLDKFAIENISFIKEKQFIETVFTECIFRHCQFSLYAFEKTSFINCNFYDCKLIDMKVQDSANNFLVYSCQSNNDFVNILTTNGSEDTIENSLDVDQLFLSKFFRQGSTRPRYKQLSILRKELDEINQREVAKTIQRLKSNKYIQMNGDICHLTKEGIAYFNEHYK